MLVDSHCHLDFPELIEDIDGVLAAMREQDIGMALTVCVNLADFPKVRGLAETHPELRASVGVHPDQSPDSPASVAELVRLAQDPRVVAIGETGLDYYRATGDLEWQRQRFRDHIRAAREASKPLIIHTRQAAADTLRIMREEGAREAGGVMHCFTEDWETAQAALDLGFCISISGIVTFKNAGTVKEVASKVPLDRLLVETDSPYLAPVPYRGKRNQPAYVRLVAQEVARLKEVAPDRIERSTTDNFVNVFKI